LKRLMIIGENLHCMNPVVIDAYQRRDPEPIVRLAKEQVAAGADYINVNVTPAFPDQPELMQWATQWIQKECDNVPIAFDTTNRAAVEAGLKVYNRSKGKPIVESWDAGDRLNNVELAAAYDAKIIGLCSDGLVAADNDERMAHLQTMLEKAMALGLEMEDMYFDPLVLVTKGMQEQQVTVLECIRLLTEMGVQTSAGLSNNSSGMPREIRPIMDTAYLGMAMAMGLTAAILNPCNQMLMNIAKSCDVIRGASIYSDSYLSL